MDTSACALVDQNSQSASRLGRKRKLPEFLLNIRPEPETSESNVVSASKNSESSDTVSMTPFNSALGTPSVPMSTGSGRKSVANRRRERRRSAKSPFVPSKRTTRAKSTRVYPILADGGADSSERDGHGPSIKRAKHDDVVCIVCKQLFQNARSRIRVCLCKSQTREQLLKLADVQRRLHDVDMCLTSCKRSRCWATRYICRGCLAAFETVHSSGTAASGTDQTGLPRSRRVARDVDAVREPLRVQDWAALQAASTQRSTKLLIAAVELPPIRQLVTDVVVAGVASDMDRFVTLESNKLKMSSAARNAAATDAQPEIVTTANMTPAAVAAAEDCDYDPNCDGRSKLSASEAVKHTSAKPGSNSAGADITCPEKEPAESLPNIPTSREGSQGTDGGRAGNAQYRIDRELVDAIPKHDECYGKDASRAMRLEEFDWHAAAEQILSEMPTLHALLQSCVYGPRCKDASDTTEVSISCLMMALSFLRQNDLSLFAHAVCSSMKSKGASDKELDLLSRLGLSVGSTSGRGMVGDMADVQKHEVHEYITSKDCASAIDNCNIANETTSFDEESGKMMKKRKECTSVAMTMNERRTRDDWENATDTNNITEPALNLQDISVEHILNLTPEEHARHREGAKYVCYRRLNDRMGFILPDKCPPFLNPCKEACAHAKKWCMTALLPLRNASLADMDQLVYSLDHAVVNTKCPQAAQCISRLKNALRTRLTEIRGMRGDEDEASAELEQIYDHDSVREILQEYRTIMEEHKLVADPASEIWPMFGDQLTVKCLRSIQELRSANMLDTDTLSHILVVPGAFHAHVNMNEAILKTMSSAALRSVPWAFDNYVIHTGAKLGTAPYRLKQEIVDQYCDGIICAAFELQTGITMQYNKKGELTAESKQAIRLLGPDFYETKFEEIFDLVWAAPPDCTPLSRDNRFEHLDTALSSADGLEQALEQAADLLLGPDELTEDELVDAELLQMAASDNIAAVDAAVPTIAELTRTGGRPDYTRTFSRMCISSALSRFASRHGAGYDAFLAWQAFLPYFWIAGKHNYVNESVYIAVLRRVLPRQIINRIQCCHLANPKGMPHTHMPMDELNEVGNLVISKAARSFNGVNNIRAVQARILAAQKMQGVADKLDQALRIRDTSESHSSKTANTLVRDLRKGLIAESWIVTDPEAETVQTRSLKEEAYMKAIQRCPIQPEKYIKCQKRDISVSVNDKLNRFRTQLQMKAERGVLQA